MVNRVAIQPVCTFLEVRERLLIVAQFVIEHPRSVVRHYVHGVNARSEQILFQRLF